MLFKSFLWMLEYKHDSTFWPVRDNLRGWATSVHPRSVSNPEEPAAQVALVSDNRQ